MSDDDDRRAEAAELDAKSRAKRARAKRDARERRGPAGDPPEDVDGLCRSCTADILSEPLDGCEWPDAHDPEN